MIKIINEFKTKLFEEHMRQMHSDKNKVNGENQENNTYKKREELHTKNCVYFITDGEYVKIGVTTDSPEKRLKELQTGNPKKLKIIKLVFVENPFEVEKAYHMLFEKKHINGEWFDILNIIEKIIV